MNMNCCDEETIEVLYNANWRIYNGLSHKSNICYVILSFCLYESFLFSIQMSYYYFIDICIIFLE